MHATSLVSMMAGCQQSAPPFGALPAGLPTEGREARMLHLPHHGGVDVRPGRSVRLLAWLTLAWVVTTCPFELVAGLPKNWTNADMALRPDDLSVCPWALPAQQATSFVHVHMSFAHGSASGRRRVSGQTVEGVHRHWGA